MTARLTLNRIEKEVKKMDPKLKPNSSGFRTAVMMFSALEVGPVTKKLVEFTGYPKEFVEPRVQRLRANKIFVGRKIRCDWFEESGAIVFWCDVAVTEGLLKRSPAGAA